MVSKLIDSISRLLKTDDTKNEEIEAFVKENIKECCAIIDAPFEEVCAKLLDLTFSVTEDSNVEWKVVCLGCHLLLEISKLMNEEILLSVSQRNCVKGLMQFIISHGIHPSLLPGVGIIHRNIESTKLNEFEKYKRLKAVCKFINKLYLIEEFKAMISVYYFSDCLAALHQLSYMPVVKPGSIITVDGKPFVMTVDIWQSISGDQNEFKNVLNGIIENSPQSVVIKELVVLQGAKPHPVPNFMKKALTRELSECLTRPGGLMATMQCFLDSSQIDIGSQWKNIDMITRLIAVKHGAMSTEEYLIIICNQLGDIFKESSNDNHIIIVAACTGSLYDKHTTSGAVNKLIQTILSPLPNLVQPIPTACEFSDICDAINRIDLCFCHPKLSLPVALLTTVIYTLFSLRIAVGKPSHITQKLDNLICKHFICQSHAINSWYDAILLRKKCTDIPVNDVIFELDGDELMCKSSGSFVNTAERIDTIVEMADSSQLEKLFGASLFSYLLNLTNDFKLSIQLTSSDLKNEYEVDTKSRTLLSITKSLEKLSGKDTIINNFKTNPDVVLDFIKTTLSKYSKDMPLSDECLTICLVLLSTLLSDSTFDRSQISDVMESLATIMGSSSNVAVHFLCKEIMNMSCDNKTKTVKNSKFDTAINLVCDPLLPVRAHGLMELTKLIEEEDVETLSKKEFVLCVFNENMKDPDSYIYLTAIKGLATLAKFIPEEILDILSKEYLNETNSPTLTSESEDENLKIRMKIGEILLKVTLKLGEKTIDHKVVLLNTFLGGCRDIDNIMRASSLSNLAELCRVLSYKLGDIIFDILKLVDNVLQNDKSVECRRAAVLVISSLIKGLGKESLLILREALSPMYRTLKKLYSDEKEDPAVRLHAQIALEELNDIMMEIMAPYLKQKVM